MLFTTLLNQVIDTNYVDTAYPPPPPLIGPPEP